MVRISSNFMSTLWLFVCLPHSANSQMTEVDAYRRVLRVIQACIADKEYGQAVAAIQACLHTDDKILIPFVNQAGDKIEISVHAEAERILKSAPPEALAVYRKTEGESSEVRLKAAGTNEEKLKALSRAYLFTNAGANGTEKLADIQFDAKKFKEAAKAYQRLTYVKPLENLAPLTLFKAAKSAHIATNTELRDRCLIALRKQAPKGIRVGDRHLSIQDIEIDIARSSER